MNKIVVNLGNFKLDEITLGRGTLSIGRASDNDISIADSATSAHHAKIVTIFTSSFIQDLNSTNGTIVNGRKVVRHTLAHGDIISIGNMQLLFKSDTSSSPARPSKTIQIGRNELKSAQQQSVKKISKPCLPETRILKKNARLSGFSISIPTAEEQRENAGTKVVVPQSRRTATRTNAASIPVLDETLPLGELRRNPDRMVILTQTSLTEKQSAWIDDKRRQPANNQMTETAAVPKEEKIIANEDDSDTLLNDSEIRKILMENETLEKHSREYAFYAVAITVVLIIIAFTYILL